MPVSLSDFRYVTRYVVGNRDAEKLPDERKIEEQLSELKTWYRAWLDGTNTQTIPEKPEWLT